MISETALIVLCVISMVFATSMVFLKSPLSVALCLLAVLLCTAGMYGLMGEHLVAALQLIVYAGAIMVLFIFAIMLLNLNEEQMADVTQPKLLVCGLGLGLCLLLGMGVFFVQSDSSLVVQARGIFTNEMMEHVGGNTRVLSHALFTQGFLAFEAISLALLVAVVGAVVLAKRKIE